MTDPAASSSPSINIVGAGTMGSGIALAALYAGFRVGLFDVSGQVLEQAEAYLTRHLERKDQLHARKQLSLSTSLKALPPADLWLEAVPEKLDLKLDVIAQVENLAGDEAVIATNTSTLSVTALAAAANRPGRVVGMHFFNPAAVLPLVEVVRGAASDPSAVERALAIARALGKTPVEVADSPGFIVNRVARPFYGEALRLLGEGAADVATIDLAVESVGFKMGPFRLMDLIGIDINFAAASSVFEQTFYEPRFRPHPIQRQMVAQGKLGRKTGSGFYDYDDGSTEAEPVVWPKAGGLGPVAVEGRVWADGLRARLAEVGFELTDDWSQAAAGFVVAGSEQDPAGLLAQAERRLPAGLPLFVQANDVALSQVELELESDRLVAFDAWFVNEARSLSLIAGQALDGQVRQRAEAVVTALGRRPLWLPDSPALILPRIVGMLVNEAAFTVGDGVAEAATVDRAMQLGANYPHGPLAWGQRLGWDKVVRSLDHLRAEYGEERYRVAPLLRRWARRKQQLA
ncbi:MAG TPA: 3-hydroxyacyl-CoA dehydrogenase NAD-binding domain-containing protein [Anaerolineales bacterium]|jgi:3-hydroxybutyryl-CoA dehydrogenase